MHLIHALLILVSTNAFTQYVQNDRSSGLDEDSYIDPEELAKELISHGVVVSQHSKLNLLTNNGKQAFAKVFKRLADKLISIETKSTAVVGGDDNRDVESMVRCQVRENSYLLLTTKFSQDGTLAASLRFQNPVETSKFTIDMTFYMTFDRAATPENEKIAAELFGVMARFLKRPQIAQLAGFSVENQERVIKAAEELLDWL